MKLTVHTQELQSSDKALLMEYDKKYGWFVFSVTDIEATDIPDEPIEFEDQKTYSERLANVLYRLHKKQGGKPEDFESYRSRIMEKLISHYKANEELPIILQDEPPVEAFNDEPAEVDVSDIPY